MGIADKKLFWWRVRRWQVIVPILLLLLAAAFLWSHTQGFEFATNGIVACQGAICTAFLLGYTKDQWFRGFKAADEREKMQWLRYGHGSLSFIAIYSILIFVLCFQSFDHPSLWAPQTKKDWQAVFFGFLCVQFGGMMISQHMTALPPLREEGDNA